MPNVTTYIRKDDLKLWLDCSNKAELIHNALHSIHSLQGTVREVKETIKRPSGNDPLVITNLGTGEVEEVLPELITADDVSEELDDHLKYDSTIGQWYDSDLETYVGKNKPKK